MKQMKLISKEEISQMIVGDEFINKLARISYYTNLSFRQLEDTKLEFNKEGLAYLVHKDVIDTIKPIHDEIKADIEILIQLSQEK